MVSLKQAVYGAAVGDAFGVPYEFIHGRLQSHVQMVGGGAHQQTAGTFSDDTSMMLAICDSIREKRGVIDVVDIRSKFENWAFRGEYTPDHYTFDIGNTVLRALRNGVGQSNEYSNGNGSLMRTLPLAFTNASDEEIAAVSAITHAHIVSCQACISYVHIARELNQGVSLRDAIAHNIPQLDVFSRVSRLDGISSEEIQATSFVVHTYEASLWSLLHTNSFQEAIMTAVNFGDDTDTTACVTGGLAAIMYGEDGIPDEWVESLRAKDVIIRCLF